MLPKTLRLKIGRPWLNMRNACIEIGFTILVAPNFLGRIFGIGEPHPTKLKFILSFYSKS